MTDISKIDSLVKTLNENIEKMKAEFAVFFDEIMSGIVLDLEKLKIEGPPHKFRGIRVMGRTPSWNDGDECVHQDYLYALVEIESDDELIPLDEDYVYDMIPDDNLFDDYMKLARRYQAELESLSKEVFLFAKTLFDTNYVLDFILSDTGEVMLKRTSPDY